jgi:hypothetical protein
MPGSVSMMILSRRICPSCPIPGWPDPSDRNLEERKQGRRPERRAKWMSETSGTQPPSSLFLPASSSANELI